MHHPLKSDCVCTKREHKNIKINVLLRYSVKLMGPWCFYWALLVLFATAGDSSNVSKPGSGAVSLNGKHLNFILSVTVHFIFMCTPTKLKSRLIAQSYRNVITLDRYTHEIFVSLNFIDIVS